jgi:hypothetical protein
LITAALVLLKIFNVHESYCWVKCDRKSKNWHRSLRLVKEVDKSVKEPLHKLTFRNRRPKSERAERTSSRRSKKAEPAEDSRRGRTRKASSEAVGSPPAKKARASKGDSNGQTAAYVSLTCPVSSFSAASGYQVTEATAIYDLKRHFFELKKEHKRDRKLVKEQQMQLTKLDE